MRTAPPTLAAYVSIRPDVTLHDSWIEDERPITIEPGEGFTTGPVLGQGGSAVVSLATQNALGRDVAVKAMRADRASPEMEQILLREAWVTGSLEHPNIVPVYDITRDSQGRVQIVLKRVTGTSWFDLLWRRDLLAETAAPLDALEWNLRTLIQVANAVHFAHERGFLHRDLKPENVMIGSYGEVYVVDWGLALRLDPQGDPRIPLARDKHRMAGTPAYMAPEMLGEGGVLGCRTDVYLLGATLFHVLTGEPPWLGDVAQPLFDRIREGVIEPPEGALGEVCRRAMSKDPADRYLTAEAFRQAVEACLVRRSADSLVAAIWPEWLYYALSGGCLVLTLNTVALWGGPEDLCLD
ncbi:MAG: serine/threonine protein kinase [Proteobacteria bacterium]|nr:serine/threonine protein kinase [Pseudomonadota bacterium]